jgi:hypothetical protein
MAVNCLFLYTRRASAPLHIPPATTGVVRFAFHIARISSCRQMRHCGVALYSIVIVQAVIQPSIRQGTDGTRSHISYRRVWEFRRLQTMPVCHRCPLGWKKSTASVQQRRTSCEWTCDWTSEPPQVLTASLVSDREGAERPTKNPSRAATPPKIPSIPSQLSRCTVYSRPRVAIVVELRTEATLEGEARCIALNTRM